MHPYRRYHLLTSLMAMLAIVSAEAQTATQVPRLVVNIVIDQLRTDYMQAFMPLYGDQGFRRLLQNGRVYNQAEFPFVSPDRASAIATLMSGASPYEHGVVGERWVNRNTLNPVYCVDDPNHRGMPRDQESTAINLQVSTITDELKVSTDGRSIVYSIAPTRDAAVLLSGHAADAAMWIDDETGDWMNSEYYGTAPAWLQTYQRQHSLRQLLSSTRWEPSSDLVGTYDYFVSGNQQKKPFRHDFKGDRRYRMFKTSGLANEEIGRLATHCLFNSDLGMDGVTDILNVAYYAGTFDHGPIDRCAMELQDTYVRLDDNLGQLMRAVEDRVGADRVMFVVSSTGYADDMHSNLERFRIPSGTFSITKAQLLLNMYLIAVYGEGQYVETSFGNQIYLNQKLIETRGLNMAEILERSQDFLIQMSGVRDVFTSHRLALASGNPAMSRMRNSYHPRCSGDILVQVAPGWHLVNENTHDSKLIRDSYMSFPLFFLGANVGQGQVDTPVSVDQVAPTLARTMRIRAPNGCSSAPLPGL